MSSPYLSSIPSILEVLQDQLDQIKQNGMVRLDEYQKTLPGRKLSQIIECIHEYIEQSSPMLFLERISLANCQLTELPSNLSIIGENLKILDLANNQLRHFPRVLADFTQLETLDLSHNSIRFIPTSALMKLRNLKILSLSSNKFSYLPPALTDLPYLRLIEVSDNPLVMPSLDLIKSFQKNPSEVDWFEELKRYLKSNRLIIETEIQKQRESNSSSDIPQKPVSLLSRSNSVTEPRSKAAKAAKRMGLILNKPSEISAFKAADKRNNTFFLNESSSDAISNSGSLSACASQSSFDHTTAVGGQGNSLNDHAGSFTGVSQPVLRNGTRMRGRSYTMKEERTQEKMEFISESNSQEPHKRLSTLQELPSEDKSKPISSPNDKGHDMIYFSAKGNHGKLKSFSQPQDVQETSRNTVNSGLSDISPSKQNGVRKAASNSVLLFKVSRKVVSFFEDLQYAIRKFITASQDKSSTVKIESHLNMTKANIETLAELLEMKEDEPSSSADIGHVLQNAIGSLRSTMVLLGENISNSSSNSDAPSLRRLYLTLYGSFNEAFNGYTILSTRTSHKAAIVPNPNLQSTPHTLDPRQHSRQPISISSSISNDLKEIDEKLGNAIENASVNAEEVFQMLNQEIENYVTSMNGVAISPQLAAKLNDLSSACRTSIESTKRVRNRFFVIHPNSSFASKKLLWDDINSFLKSILQIFSTVKDSMNDFPFLNDIRSSMASLTKATKDVTILLEVSSYKSASSDSQSSVPETPAPNIMTKNSYSPLNGTGRNAATPQLTSRNTSQTISNHISNHPSHLDLPNIGDVGSYPVISTAPANSVGQIYAKNGINPFDKLIMSTQDKSDGSKNTHEI